MRGIGDRLERATRIKILQDKAFKYNDQFDKLEEQGNNPDEIRKALLEKDFESRHVGDELRILPFDENKKVIKVSGGTDFGFDQTHKALSATKQMYSVAKQNFETKKELKQKGLKDPDAEYQAELYKFLRQDLQKRYKEQDEAMKKKIYKDHIQQMMSGEGFQKGPEQSNYQENYEFNKDFQKECDDVDFAHHQKKNDLKWYSEAYVKYKTTLRK